MQRWGLHSRRKLAYMVGFRVRAVVVVVNLNPDGRKRRKVDHTMFYVTGNWEMEESIR